MRPTDQPLDMELAELLDDLQLRVAHLEYLVLPQANDAETMARIGAAPDTGIGARYRESGHIESDGRSESEGRSESDVDAWAVDRQGIEEPKDADEAPYPPLLSPPPLSVRLR